jgi:hypothetical protein
MNKPKYKLGELVYSSPQSGMIIDIQNHYGQVTYIVEWKDGNQLSYTEETIKHYKWLLNESYWEQ